jgi:hypothetical protein
LQKYKLKKMMKHIFLHLFGVSLLSQVARSCLAICCGVSLLSQVARPCLVVCYNVPTTQTSHLVLLIIHLFTTCSIPFRSTCSSLPFFVSKHNPLLCAQIYLIVHTFTLLCGFSLQANYTDSAKLVSTFVDRRVSRGQCGGSLRP